MTIANVPRWRKMLTRKRRQLRDGVGEVAGALFDQRAQDEVVGADQVARQARGVLGPQHRQARDRDGFQLAVPLDLRRATGGEHEVADARASPGHRRDERRRLDGPLAQGSEESLTQLRAGIERHIPQAYDDAAAANRVA